MGNKPIVQVKNNIRAIPIKGDIRVTTTFQEGTNMANHGDHHPTTTIHHHQTTINNHTTTTINTRPKIIHNNNTALKARMKP